jgi:hypothetical protein
MFILFPAYRGKKIDFNTKRLTLIKKMSYACVPCAFQTDVKQNYQKHVACKRHAVKCALAGVPAAPQVENHLQKISELEAQNELLRAQLTIAKLEAQNEALRAQLQKG